MTMKRLIHLTCIASAAVIGSSCTNSSHLLLYQHSNMGMNTGINPANQNVHVRIGVRSEFAAVVPKYKKKEEEPAPGQTTKPEPNYEAASAYFGSRFRVSSIWQIPEAAEVLVTGQAAVIAASNGRLRLAAGHDQPQVTMTPATKPGEAQVTPEDSTIPASTTPPLTPLATAH